MDNNRATAKAILKTLKSRYSERNREGMKRFGIKVDRAYGISVTELRSLAKKIGRDHELALSLWKSGIHEARILASLVDEPDKVSKKQMELWTRDFDSWDVSDQVCSNLYSGTPYGHQKAKLWCNRREEYVKRAGFALIAAITVHDKKASDQQMKSFLPLIERQACDERNFVRKAVNWALRQIGKRNVSLRKAALQSIARIRKRYPQSKAAMWVAADAERELLSKTFKK